MFGHHAWLDSFDEARQAFQMTEIKGARRAEREADAVERDGVRPPDLLEGGEGRSVRHVVLGVHLDPGDDGAPVQELADVTSPEPDAGNPSMIDRGVHAVPESSGPRLGAAADELFAGAGRHIDPGVLLPVAAGGARTGRVGRLAVVLARLGDAVALLRLELGLGGGPGLAI